MRVLDPGHHYALDNLKDTGESYIKFYKEEDWSSGPSCQEVLRVLIDRVKFLHNEKPHWVNAFIIACLRKAICLFEIRALEQNVEKGWAIETAPVNVRGHIV